MLRNYRVDKLIPDLVIAVVDQLYEVWMLWQRKLL